MASATVCVVAGGCRLGVAPYPKSINAPDPGLRIMAVREAGERGDGSAVPLLVDRLEDEDEGVRFYAILALEKITGTRMGYDYRKPAQERALAVNRWRSFLDSRPRAATQPGQEGPGA